MALTKTRANLLALLLGLAVAWGLAETYLYVASHLSRRRINAALAPQLCPGTHRRAVWYQRIGTRAPVLLSSLRPFCRDVELDVRHNSHGFRGPEVTLAHPPQTVRVSVLGDSFTWGQGVREDELFTRVLAAELDGACADAARVEVLNHGVQGARVVDHFIRLVAHVEALRPDLVVVELTGNDLYYYPWEATLPVLNAYDVRRSRLAGWPPFSTLARTRPAFELSDLYVAERLRSYAPQSPEWRLFTAALERFRQWSREHHTPVFFLVFPDVSWEPSNFGHYTAAPPAVKVLERAAQEIAAHGLPVLDLAPAFGRRAGNRPLAISQRDQHPNPTAHRIAGEELGRALREAGLVSCSTAAARPPDPRWEPERALRRQAGRQWSELARSHRRQVDFFAAVRALYPENLWNLEQLAFLHLEMGDHGRSAVLYRQLADLGESLAAPWIYLAEMSAGADRRRLLERMAAVAPDHADALELLIPYYFGEGRHEEGCALVVRAAKNARYPDQMRRVLAINRRYGCAQPRQLVHPAGR